MAQGFGSRLTHACHFRDDRERRNFIKSSGGVLVALSAAARQALGIRVANRLTSAAEWMRALHAPDSIADAINAWNHLWQVRC